MTKRSGFNISIDKPINPLTPKYVANHVGDPERNSLIKLSNKAKFAMANPIRDGKSDLQKKEDEAKYF